MSSSDDDDYFCVVTEPKKTSKRPVVAANSGLQERSGVQHHTVLPISVPRQYLSFTAARRLGLSSRALPGTKSTIPAGDANDGASGSTDAPVEPKQSKPCAGDRANLINIGTSHGTRAGRQVADRSEVPTGNSHSGKCSDAKGPQTSEKRQNAKSKAVDSSHKSKTPVSMNDFSSGKFYERRSA